MEINLKLKTIYRTSNRNKTQHKLDQRNQYNLDLTAKIRTISETLVKVLICDERLADMYILQYFYKSSLILVFISYLLVYFLNAFYYFK